MCGISHRDAVRFGPLSARADAQELQSLWQFIGDRLPPCDGVTSWLTSADLAPILGIGRRGLDKHAREVFPWWPRRKHFRFNTEQAVALVRRVTYAGNKLPPRDEIERLLQQLHK